ncbi:MAG: RNA polymerase sigma-70 factor [Cyclobacteriaceae bacterium]|jgi:RNA polymerase sigma-70 factor (family 1)
MSTQADKDKAILLLAEKLRKGDKQAFRQVYDRYHQQLYAFSLRFTRSSEDAKEVVQAVFLNLWKYRSNLKSHRSLEPYLYQIARNENLKLLQKIAKDTSLREKMSQRLPLSSLRTEEEIVYSEYEAIARKAIALLPPKRKLIYEMTYQQGKTVKEVAVAMGISVQTVRTQLSQAINAIKNYLQQHADISFGMVCALLPQLIR